MFTIRRDGRDSYYYDRWAAQRIDRRLLGGPAAFVAWVEQLMPTREPFVERFICGAVLVDLDRRDVLYWASMCFSGGALRRYYRSLLAERWPGFTMRAAVLPAQEFAAALAVEIRELDEARANVTLAPAPDDLFTRAWQELMAHYRDDPEELARWIAASGMEAVRSAAEYGCNAWLTVRAADGTLFDQLGHTMPWDGLLRVGPRLAALARSGGPRPDLLWPGFERDIRETVFVDEAALTVHWWQDDPEWLSVQGHCAVLWPGWRLVHDDGGTRGHIERSGRPLAAIRLPRDEQREQLADMLARLTESKDSPLALLAREAARLRAEHPDATIRVETSAMRPDAPGEGEVPPGSFNSLDALIERVDGF